MSAARLMLLVFTSLAFVPAADAQMICDTGHRQVKLNDRSVDLQEYNCSLNGPSAGLRVTFYRVSEVVAGTLVMGAGNPFIDQILGPVTFLDNDVYQEVKYLFANFGKSLTYESPDKIDWSVTVTGTRGASVNLPVLSPAAGTPVKIWYLSRLFGSILSDGVILKAPSEVILNTDHWPLEYKMTYRCGDGAKDFISCTRIWKYIGQPDFRPIIADIKAAYKRAEQHLRAAEASSKDFERAHAKDTVASMSDFDRNFALYNYLARHSMPADFLFISGDPVALACDESNWYAAYSGKPLTLDLAVIENLTAQPVNVDHFLGQTRTDIDFRPAAESASGLTAFSSVALGPAMLAPGGKVALALRMVFGNDTGGDDSELGPPDMATDAVPADQTYRRIHSSPAHHLFTENIGGFNSRKTIKKTRESFQPPERPDFAVYAYGPELALSGLSLDGKSFRLNQQAANAVETRTSTGDAPFPDRRGNKDVDLGINKIAATPVGPRDGSCPILYSWREDAQAWIYHGKVLHNADGPEQAMTDRLSFPSLRTRFRIAEEEPEASFIDHVHLNLTLRDGRTVRLEPRQPVSHVIRANTAADVDFELPADISPNEVLKSEIEIGGYYRRYSEVLSAETDATSAAGQAQTPARLPQQ